MSQCRTLPLLVLLIASSARADVAPVGGEFQVNTFTTGDQSYPQVCSDASGRFTVVWQSGSYSVPDLVRSHAAIRARHVDPTGLPQATEFVANSGTIGPQLRPAIAAAPSGEFVVSWHGYEYPDGSGFGAFVQPFSAAGTRVGSERHA